MRLRTGIRAGNDLCKQYTEMKKSHENSVRQKCGGCDALREKCRICDMERQKLLMTNWDETLKSFC